MRTIHHATPCPNKNCSAYGDIPEDPSEGTVIRYGHSKTGRQRYRCTRCGHTFTETVGTIFYRRRTPDDEIVSALSQIAEGSRLSSVARPTGHKIDTISAGGEISRTTRRRRRTVAPGRRSDRTGPTRWTLEFCGA